MIVFVDVWPAHKKYNKELAEFFGKEQNRGEILFYCNKFAMEKLIDDNFETLEHKEYLKDISLGTNLVDMHLLMERVAYYYFKQGKSINNIYLELGDYEDLTLFEKKLFAILTNAAREYPLKKHSLCTYQTCKRAPIKILFSDKDGTIFDCGMTREQIVNNLLALQDFTNQGNIVVVITKGHGASVFGDFEVFGGNGYSNPNLYGMVISQMASVCINNAGKMIYDENYPSLPIAIGHEKDKKEAVKLFLEYFLEIGYTFDGIYAVGDSENDFGMLAYVESIGGVSNLIGRDIATFADFITNIKDDTSKSLYCSDNDKCIKNLKA